MEKYKALRIPITRKINQASILIIGGTNRMHEDLLQALIKVFEAQELLLKIRVEEKLPLQTDVAEHFIEADLILICISADSRQSYESADKSLPLIPLDFFQGHILMVIHKPNSLVDECVESERISFLADSYMCPVLWDRVGGRNEYTALRILQKLKVASGMISIPPSLLVGTLAADVP